MKNKENIRESYLNKNSITAFTLFTTTGTLLCCALPILLVSLGMGATVVAMTSTFPFLIVLTHYKIWIFVFSGLMLMISAWFLYRSDRSCPADEKLARACNTAHTWNKRIYWGSVSIWIIGFITAYLLLPIRIWFDV